LTGVH